jgi:hypothetical protein
VALRRLAQEAAVQQWEYMYWHIAQGAGAAAWLKARDGARLDHYPDLAKALLEAGQDGWELVGCDNGCWVLKRPKRTLLERG